MKIKKGDTVKVLSGKDRGKTGTVLQVLTTKTGTVRVVVDGVNKLKKHLRAGRGQSGQRIELSAPLDKSNLMLVHPKSGKPTRVGFRIEEGNKKRVAKKTAQLID